MDLEFKDREPRALSVIDLLGWIERSQFTASWSLQPPLTLPALQRNGVWRPSQVLDLWRSVLDGMPIGLFYLQSAGEYVVNPDCRTELIKAPPYALDLFDGQQRIRALALGSGDPFGDGRCLWIKFEEDSYRLILSSRTQPSGYGRDGGKLPVRERRKELEQFATGSGMHHPSMLERGGRDVVAPAYSHDCLSYPYGCSSKDTAKLADLLRRPSSDGVVLDAGAFPDNATEGVRERLKKDVARLDRPCAVFMRLPREFDKDLTRSLELFRRIGAGGTPLSEAEQVYSAFKLSRPELRKVVENIHGEVSSILTPAQIIQAAVRMAHVESRPNTGWVPGFHHVMQGLSNKGDLESWVANFDRMISDQNGQAPLAAAFKTVMPLLSTASKIGVLYLPKVVMAQLPSELWQAFTFWSLARESRDIDASRAEAVRFALAWHLAVTNSEKAVQVCCRHLVQDRPSVFPGRSLYARIVTEGYAHRIPTPGELAPFFLRPDRDDPHWLGYDERFPAKAEHRDVASAWWFGRKMLPWLQRDYLERQFPSYDPMSDHEDDLPYDQDHICPRSHWAPDRRTYPPETMGFKDRADQEKYMGQPGMIGDSIGNMRLVEFSQNRGDGDTSIFEKMPFLDPGSDRTDLGSPTDFLMDDPTLLHEWKTVDTKPPRQWTKKRLEAFQHVVECRTAMLYERFYDQLDFGAWL